MTRVTEAHVEARKQSILDAAQKTFARKGMQSATMAEIASAAGISAGAIYRYYASKEVLAWACMKHGAESITASWQRMAEDSDDPLAVFLKLSQESFDEMKAEGAEDMTRLMVENILDAARSSDAAMVEAARDEHKIVAKGLAAAIERAVLAGQLPAEVDSCALGEALFSFYMGARLAKLLDPANDTDAQLQQVWLIMNAAARVTGAGKAAKRP